jgi:hypothetical protein
MTEEEVRELRRALIRALVGIIPVAAILGIQWWITTPGPEREVAFARLGVTRCRVGVWHVLGMPRRCLCRWPQETTADQRFEAEMAEGLALRRVTEK